MACQCRNAMIAIDELRNQVAELRAAIERLNEAQKPEAITQAVAEGLRRTNASAEIRQQLEVR